MIDIFIPGKPIGKGRPRVCRKVTYTPKPTKDYEKLVRQCYIAKYADKQPIPAKIPLKVSIIANYPITQSMPKKQVKIIENGGVTNISRKQGWNTLKKCFQKPRYWEDAPNFALGV